MALISPFRGLRAAPDCAQDVVAPPYDVVSFDEALDLAKGSPDSFLHISRAEIDLPAGTDPYSAPVYRQAAVNLERLLEQGRLLRESTDCYYLYRMSGDGHAQLGLVAAASVSAYKAGQIKRHEFTRPDKEDDRVRQIDALAAQTGPVLLAYRADKTLDDYLAGLAEASPVSDVQDLAGIRHELWVVSDPEALQNIGEAVERIGSLYIADGHHRSAAAARVADNQARDHGFLAVMFPHSKMRILDYNRVVHDLNGLQEEAFLAQLESRFVIRKQDKVLDPEAKNHFAMYLGGCWYGLALKPEYAAIADPVASLDVSLLSEYVLSPLLGIQDPRTDSRISFVGGIRGLDALSDALDARAEGVAFALYPTRMSDLMAVADQGEVMPPKSTWFEPKLLDGLVSLTLDDD